MRPFAVLMIFLCLFDVETNLRFACFLGDLLWKYYKRGRQRALENLRASFPEKSEEWIQQTGRRSFEQLVMLTIDVLVTPRLVQKHNWRQYCALHQRGIPEMADEGGQGPDHGDGPLRQLRAHRVHGGPLRLRCLQRRPAAGQQVPEPLPVRRAAAAWPQADRQEGRRRDDAPRSSSRAARSASSPTRTPAAKASSSISSGERPAPTRASVCWRSPTTCPSWSAAPGGSATGSSSTMC